VTRDDSGKVNNAYFNAETLKHPGAWLPPAMSIAALALVLGHIALFGAAREPDEGTTAHLFQLLMAGQTLVMAFFAIKWLPRDPSQALPITALKHSPPSQHSRPSSFSNCSRA
jgi:hypothetical protein